MSEVKKFKIDGKIYWAETPESAYEQYAKGWRDVGVLEGGFKPSVPVFAEHPEEPRTALELGTEMHRALEEVELKTGVPNVIPALGAQTGRTDSSKPNISNARRAETPDYDFDGLHLTPGRHTAAEAVKGSSAPLPKGSREFRNDDGKFVLEFEGEDGETNQVKIADESRYWWRYMDSPAPCAWRSQGRSDLFDVMSEEVGKWLEHQWDTNGSAPNVQNVNDAFKRVKFLEN